MIPLGLWAGISTAYAAIQKKIYRSDKTTLIILNKEMEDVMKIVKSLEESRLLIGGLAETFKNETNKKGGFLPILLGILLLLH